MLFLQYESSHYALIATAAFSEGSLWQQTHQMQAIQPISQISSVKPSNECLQSKHFWHTHFQLV
jgi:hypothetical protein